LLLSFTFPQNGILDRRELRGGVCIPRAASGKSKIGMMSFCL